MSSSPTPTSSVVTPCTPLPSRRADCRRIHTVEWLLIGHKANIRRGSEASAIWEHGDEYIDLARPDTSLTWICNYCDSIVAIRKNGASFNMFRHLKDKHGILLKRTRTIREEEDDNASVLSRESSASQQTPSGFGALFVRCDVDKFRNLLLQWIIQQQVPHSAVEQQEFRDLLLYLQPSLERYLISRNTITNWVLNEYTKAQSTIKTLLARAQSRVHLSFDIWTSPSVMPILGICSHFLSPSLELNHALLGLKIIEGSHTGEAIAEIIAGVVKEFEIEDKLGVYVADNASNCDTCCRELVKRFHSNEEEGSRRSRCLGHIINLAAQAFIYGKENEAFVSAIEHLNELSVRDQDEIAQEQALWRARGAFGKLHNIVKFVRVSPRRRQDFEAVIEMVIQQRTARGT